MPEVLKTIEIHSGAVVKDCEGGCGGIRDANEALGRTSIVAVANKFLNCFARISVELF